MTRRTLLQVLKRHGVEEYVPKDEKYNPEKHKKVGEVQGNKGMVVEVLRNGWTVNNVLIQLPEVKVGV